MELVLKNFKKSDVGLIPIEWVVKEIEELAEVKSGKRLPLGNSLTDKANSHPYIRVADMYQGGVDMSEMLYVPNEVFPFIKNYCIHKEDIFISVAGTLGVVGIIPDILDGANLTENANKFTNIKCNRDYLLFVLMSNLIQNRIEAERTLGAQPKLALTRIRKFQIPLPPTEAEQNAIAIALLDTDNLIKGLEKIIAKKRNIKQGAMQKLLLPKEGWEVKPFKDLCWFQEGPGLRNWQFTKRGIKVINVTNLENGLLNLDRTDRHISLDEFHKMYEHFEIDENDIVVASSGNSYGKVAVVRKQDLPLVMNTSVIRFKPLSNLDYNFLLTYLKSSQFKNQIDLLITGGAQPNFGPVHLNKITINMPPTKEEQTKTASVLLDMDNEILALETKLDKYKSIKQGMMQNLLTGKIRLV